VRPIRLSFTRNLACPEKHQRLYQLGEKESPAPFTATGSMLHEIAAEYIRTLSRRGLKRKAAIYYGIFNNHTERILDDDLVFEMQDIGENFAFHFEIDSRVERNLVEFEMAVTRDFQPIPINDAMHPNGTAKLDCFTGIADYLGIQHGGETALHGEWKMGNQMFDMFEAQQNRQIQGYAYLWFKTDSRCQHIASTLFAPKFNQLSFASFDRDVLVPEFEEYLAGEWAKADALRAEYGDESWPAWVNFREACNFCRLHPYCQPKQEVIEQWRAA